MGFKDVIVTRELETNEDIPYKKIAIFLNTDIARQDFESKYDTSLITDEITLEKWFICSYNEMFEEPIVTSIVLLDDFIEDSISFLLSISKELEWARSIK